MNQAAVDYVRQWGGTVGNAEVASFIPANVFHFGSPLLRRDSERALFGEFTIGLLERLDLKLGFRWAEDDVAHRGVSAGRRLPAVGARNRRADRSLRRRRRDPG